MKPFYNYLLKLSGLFLLAFLLQGCEENAGVWKNEQIKTGKRDDFHALNNQALKDLKANDPKHLRALLCKELIDDGYTDRLVELISNQLNDNAYNLFDEYYVINKFRDRDTIKSGRRDINRYTLAYPGTAREMYLAFFIPKAGDNKYMVSLIYAKYSYGWKISKLDLAPYTINGKTAPELYQQAKEKSGKNYLIDAVNTMALANTCVQPSEIWEYPDAEEMNHFYGVLLDEANNQYKFPFLLNGVLTKPKIIRVFNQTIPEGTFPAVYYLSSINLKDTTAIKNENANIKKVIGQVMPGIDKDKKYVLYSAFNEIPNGKKTVEHFDITDKLP